MIKDIDWVYGGSEAGSTVSTGLYLKKREESLITIIIIHKMAVVEGLSVYLDAYFSFFLSFFWQYWRFEFRT
jgi:hypothetical protein